MTVGKGLSMCGQSRLQSTCNAWPGDCFTHCRATTPDHQIFADRRFHQSINTMLPFTNFNWSENFPPFKSTRTQCHRRLQIRTRESLHLTLQLRFLAQPWQLLCLRKSPTMLALFLIYPNFQNGRFASWLSSSSTVSTLKP